MSMEKMASSAAELSGILVCPLKAQALQPESTT